MSAIFGFIYIIFPILMKLLSADKAGNETENFKICDSKSPSCRTDCIAAGRGICRSKNNKLRFALIGDSGGLPTFPYITYAQTRVANALAKQARQEAYDFILNVGDNFYYTGVKKVDDSRFQASFEDVYKSSEFSVPWYLIAGNHDHFGNISAQHLYTKESTKWTFPSSYYKISYEFGQNLTTVDIIMIDTIVLCGNTRDVSNSGFFNMIFANVDKDPNDPKDPAAADAQLKWIEKQLSASTADYLFVAGHYPIYSISEHGSMRCPIAKIDPLLKKYFVTAYFCGHDHTLQHISMSYSNSEKNLEEKMNYIVSGAASRMDRSTKHMDDIPPGTLLFNYPNTFNPFSQLGFSNGAFVIAEIDSYAATFSFYSGTSNKKYEFSVGSRKIL